MIENQITRPNLKGGRDQATFSPTPKLWFIWESTSFGSLTVFSFSFVGKNQQRKWEDEPLCSVKRFCIHFYPPWTGTGWSNWTDIIFGLITPDRSHSMKWDRCPFSHYIWTFWYIVSKNSNRFHKIFSDWCIGGVS